MCGSRAILVNLQALVIYTTSQNALTVFEKVFSFFVTFLNKRPKLVRLLL